MIVTRLSTLTHVTDPKTGRTGSMRLFKVESGYAINLLDGLVQVLCLETGASTLIPFDRVDEMIAEGAARGPKGK